MTTESLEMLKAAIDALERGESDDAVHLLEALQSRAPDARAAYLLGAEYAQRGNYDAAEVQMREAVRLDPTLGTAHLQLGLLLLTQGRAADATAALRGLDALPPDDPLQHFRAGLEHLARDEFVACLQSMQSGMAANTANPALNGDMQRIVDRVREHLAAQQPTATDGSGHVFLSAYRSDGPVRH